MKSTPERVLDAAEDLFAAKGFEATSMGEVAEAVGIKAPSLYNHFRNKEALYEAVLDRLIEKFKRPMTELVGLEQVSAEQVLAWQRHMIDAHVENPNLARLMQYAALSGGPGVKKLIDELIRPLIAEPVKQITGIDSPSLVQRPDLRPWVVMAFNNIVMSYITMGPMYRDIIGVEPFSDEAKAMQAESINLLTRAFMNYDPDTGQ
ncbi:MAG: TetR/AcrR family transcriptional regulator [Pseudomonadales bacterium]